MLAHNVFFTLHDPTPAAVNGLVEACHRYLKEHPGVVFFAAGARAEQLSRPVNDLDFHVALHLVFRDQATHDAYQVAESHKQFIDENQSNWKQVRVFDSVVD